MHAMGIAGPRYNPATVRSREVYRGRPAKRGVDISVTVCNQDSDSMRRTFTSLLFATAVFCSAVPLAVAHPGHGVDGGSHEITHYATEPEHVLPTVVLAIVAVASIAGVMAWAKKRS